MKILLVEDEPKIGQALRRGLVQERYLVELATSGPQGLASAQADHYDLIILDRMLPGGLDGVDICQRLRQAGSAVPILMLTAKDQVRDRVEGLRSGADDYLGKPFAFDELLARVEALLRRPQTVRDETLACDTLSINTVSMHVSRAGKALALSAREYALLVYLLRNQDRVLTKEMIIANVWEYDADVLPNTVEVYIGYLRAKTDRPFPGRELIRTVRGFGYQLSAPDRP